jgi:Right handed beta helix region
MKSSLWRAIAVLVAVCAPGACAGDDEATGASGSGGGATGGSAGSAGTGATSGTGGIGSGGGSAGASGSSGGGSGGATGSVGGGCPTSGYARLVQVGTATELAAALSDALPGDQIRVAAGLYLGATSLVSSGTASAPITLCGVAGTWPVLQGGRFTLAASHVVVTGLIFEGPNNSNNNVYIHDAEYVLFSHNEVRNGDWHAGIAIETSGNVEISQNFIHDNGLTDIDHGIYFRLQSGANVIANNLIVNNHGRGISMHDNGGAAVSDARVVHNTIVRNGSTGLLHNVNAGTGNVIANNVFSDNGWIYGYKQVRVQSGSSNIVSNNIVWSPEVARQGIEESGGASNTVSGNVIQDPLFVSAYADLHLSPGSPAVGLGLPAYGVSIDFDGKPRTGAPDAGAFEL